MRVDYWHSGGPQGEAVRLDRVGADGPWPGSRTQLIDETGLGKYFFQVIDRASNRVLYSRGFASIYGEWETTPEIRSIGRTFHESMRFPWPASPVRVVLKKRDAQNTFQDFWSVEIDPGASTVDRTPRAPAGAAWPLLESGTPEAKVDVLLIADGYPAADLPRFRSDATRLLDVLFRVEPFKNRRADFNVRALGLPGSSVSAEYNIFGLERYALTYNNRQLRDIASSAPYDVVVVLMNQQNYGGGGIFNLQSVVAAGSERSDYVFVHELAHNLAGLGDEYTGNVTYETGAPVKVEPWEPNVTALHDPARLKWRDLVEPGTPIPTPMSYAGKVGAFEGAGYETRGLFRPEAECIMGSRKLVGFCRVCQRAISRAMDTYTK
jgi:IgA Peptidase M64/Peptidase M64 N-terminus